MAILKHGVIPKSGVEINRLSADRDWNKIKDSLPTVIDAKYLPKKDVFELLRLMNAGFTTPASREPIIQQLASDQDAELQVQAYFSDCAAYISTAPCDDPGYLEILKHESVLKSLQLFEAGAKPLIAADLPSEMRAWASLMPSTWEQNHAIRDADVILNAARESFEYFADKINSALPGLQLKWWSRLL
jgi:hypothetical protein